MDLFNLLVPGLDYMFWVAVSGSMTAVIVVMGGMRGTSYNQAFQGIIIFVAMALPFVLRSQKIPFVLKGQLFHLYLISYGIFRFWHEFHRETPRILGPFSGYHFGALALVALGTWRGVVRQKQKGREAVNG